MALGRGFRMIARELKVSEICVRGRAKRIYDKLGAENRVEAVTFAMHQQIVDVTTFYGS